MSSQSTGVNNTRRIVFAAVAGCLLVALCIVALGAAGAAYYIFSARTTARSGQTAVEYVLDASPRMTLAAEASNGEASRLVIARSVLAEIVRPADPAVSAALRVFGSGALPQACRDTDLLVPLAPASQLQISDHLRGLQAGAAADAAMAEAMVAAIRDLASLAGPHSLVVVTGGSDSCNPEAGQLIAREAERAGIKLQLFVVGYQVPASQGEAIKGYVAESQGTYLEAFSEEELRAILKAIQDYVDGGSAGQLEYIQTLPTPGVIQTAVAAAALTPAPASGAGTPSAEIPATTPASFATAAAPAVPGGYAAQTACDHPYLPLRLGANWVYQSSEGSFTWKVTEVTGDLSSATAVMVMEVGETTITNNWSCSDQGIVWHNFGAFSAGAADSYAQFELLASDGAWLPAPENLYVGAAWTHAYSMRMTMAGAGDLNMVADVVMNITASGLEQVVAPAGTYETLRLDGTGENTLNIAGVGANADVSTYTYLLARGVGIVRSTTVWDGGSSTIELVSVYIP
jgi:hypothetical protein